MPSPKESDHVVLRAEFPSLEAWLRDALTEDELSHIGIVSLNQWPFMCAVVGEVALTAQAMGSRVSVGMWADDTPLPDPGWTTSRRVARLLGSHALDERLEQALVSSGLPGAAIVRPPIRRWRPRGIPDTPQPAYRSEIRRLTYRGSGMGRSILQVHPDDNTSIREDQAWPRAYVTEAIRSYAWVYDQVDSLIRQRGITTLVVYNGRFTHDQAAAAAAENAGIRVLYYDAGGLETGFDLTFAPTHDWGDLQRRMLAMWENWPADERAAIGRSWFLNRQEHREPGLRVFVEFQERGNLAGLPSAEVLVAFFSSSPDEIAELDLDWANFHGSQPGALAALAEVVKAHEEMELVVRTHPHMRLKPPDDLTDWRAAVAEAGPAAHFDAADAIDSYALMQSADVVVTYGSTSGVEAAFMGKPVVVLGPSAYDRLGCVDFASSVEELTTALEERSGGRSEAALPYGLMMQRRGFNFSFVDKRSHDVFTLGGVPLSDARQLALNLSMEWRRRRMRRLVGSS